MINSDVLLTDLKSLLGQLEDDLRERADEVATFEESLRSAYERAKQAERTAQSFETWREEYLTQAAVAWILACVFVRFIEDNGLIDTPLLAGSGPRLGRAKDQRTLFFQQHPTDSDREYLHYAFRKVKALPAAAPLFDERHNPLWAFGVSGDGATLLIEFWQRIDPATGALAHDFADASLNTRFLGDLYQDLSEAARKKYALLQTPEFVEEFILGRTLTPAIAEFGLAEVRLIDPACGSGHFLLGAFHCILQEWQKHQPAVNVRELTQRALDAISGVDLNPYAVAIARFRLLIAALKASDVYRLSDAPAFHINLATGDSLLHGPRPGGERQLYLAAEADPLRHVYDTEDADELWRILGGQYHVVVGNPPYIAVKDRALSDAYRRRFGSCYMKYSLAVPFMERFFDLALASPDGPVNDAGYVGMITASSFMKREFGKRLIEEFVPRWDLTHVIDTDKAQLPGHATGTAILFARNRTPVLSTVRVVTGLRKEEPAPANPATGFVWLAILDQIDKVNSQSKFVSSVDMPRQSFHVHPWNIGGGGAAELKSAIEETAQRRVGDIAEAIGITSVTGEDEVYVLSDMSTLRRLRIDRWCELVTGDRIRDWSCERPDYAVWLYDSHFALEPLRLDDGTARYLWPFRRWLSKRKRFGTPMLERGLTWYEWQELYVDKLQTSFAIAFAEVATHNHFVFTRGDKVFKQTAPVIKLPSSATADAHISLIGVLNSSTACFWLRQSCYDKGAGGIGGGIAAEPWEHRFAFNSANVERLPLVDDRPDRIASELQALSEKVATLAPERILSRWNPQVDPLASVFQVGRAEWTATMSLMISLQEELDWRVYSTYKLLSESVSYAQAPPAISLGERAFEISLARRMTDGDIETTWFARHNSIPITALPARWPTTYAALVERRIAIIESDPTIGLIEQPEYKRRWNVASWEERQQSAVRAWLLDRLEEEELWSRHELTTISGIADYVRRNDDLMQVAELYRGRADFDVVALIAELIEATSVPFLSVLRYKAAGLRKRAAWEQIWELQRREDAIDARACLPANAPDRLTIEQAAALKQNEVGDIPYPPEYGAKEFRKDAFRRLRGVLDVPRERFISYPNAEREADSTLVIGWAGWDHLEQAKALAAWYVRMKDREGWAPERLKPLLAGLLELVPWLKQWHNELDPGFGIGMGDYFADFVDEEARALGFTLDDVRAWQPPARNSRRRRRASV